MVGGLTRVAVTGASGFVGRHLLSALDRKGIPYVAIGRTRPPTVMPSRFKSLDLLGGDLRAHIADLACTHLIHLAWFAEHGRYWTSTVNLDWVTASLSLIREFCENGSHVTAVGSCAEYDWTGGVCIEGKTPIEPDSLYGKAKAATSNLALALCGTENVPCCWARLFFPFGDGECSERLIPSVVDALLDRRPPISVGGENWRDFLAAEDVADALVHLALTGYCGEVNVCSGVPRQIGGVVNEIAKCLGCDRGSVFDKPSSVSDARWIIGDDTRLRLSGWVPAFSFSDRLNAYVDTRRAMSGI